MRQFKEKKITGGFVSWHKTNYDTSRWNLTIPKTVLDFWKTGHYRREKCKIIRFSSLCGHANRIVDLCTLCMTNKVGTQNVFIPNLYVLRNPGLTVIAFWNCQTSCLNKSLVLKWFYGLEQEKIIEYDLCHIGNM